MWACVHIQENFTPCNIPQHRSWHSLKDKEQTGSFQVTQWEAKLEHKLGGPAPQPLCCLEIQVAVIHRGSARGVWRKLTSDHGTPLQMPPGASYWTLKKSEDLLWPLKLALVTLQTHQNYSPVLFAAVHLYLSIPKVCQGPSHLRTLAHPAPTAWGILHPTSCTALHMVGTISLFQYFLRRWSP